MSDFQSLDQELAQALMNGMAEESSDSSANSRSDSIQDLVNALVEAIPYYSDPAAVAAHKDALGRQLALNLPTAVVEAPPSHGSNSYMYRGSYSNYFQAYYRNVAQTASQQELAAQVTAAASQLNKSWWGNYSVAVLTDSCDSHYSVDIDDARLRDRLDSLHHEFLPGLTPSYLAIFTKGYAPTKEALDAIFASGQAGEAAELINSGIGSNGFRTNFNAMILTPGDNALAAEWFQYNLWVSLKTLGYPDVDAAISEHIDEGLIVHDPLGPSSWWTGAYNTWYTAANGDHVYEFAKATMQENFPYEYCWGSPPAWGCMDESDPQGYVTSLCEWGSLNYYH